MQKSHYERPLFLDYTEDGGSTLLRRFYNMPIYSLNMSTRLFHTVNSSVTLVSLFNTHVQFVRKKRDNYFFKVISNSVSRCIGLYCVISVRLWTALEENADFITKSI